MDEPLLPLFPLGLVLLPGTPLALHIFEDRYKEMIGDALARKTEFGIVQAGENGILNIGCTATIEAVPNRYPDGRMDIVVVGRRRFEIILLDEEKPYLRAAVSFFDDEDEESPGADLRALAVAGLHVLQSAGSEEGSIDADDNDPRLSFKIAFYIPDLPLKQTLLSLRSESSRLRQLNEFLPQYLARFRRAQHVKKVAPTNGHGFLTIGPRSGE